MEGKTNQNNPYNQQNTTENTTTNALSQKNAKSNKQQQNNTKTTKTTKITQLKKTKTKIWGQAENTRNAIPLKYVTTLYKTASTPCILTVAPAIIFFKIHFKTCICQFNLMIRLNKTTKNLLMRLVNNKKHQRTQQHYSTNRETKQPHMITKKLHSIFPATHKNNKENKKQNIQKTV